jgi:rubrerythrin
MYPSFTEMFFFFFVVTKYLWISSANNENNKQAADVFVRNRLVEEYNTKAYTSALEALKKGDDLGDTGFASLFFF